MKFYNYPLSVLLMTASINCFSFTAKEKADAIFDVVEQNYSYYFSPKESTISSRYGNEIAYFRRYTNQFRSVLWAQQGNLWFSLDGEWYYYGTIDQANQYLCDNRCFSKKTSVKISGTTEFVSQTEKALERLKNYAPDAFQKIQTYIGVIEQGDRSGMSAYEVPPKFEVTDTTAFYSVTWYASTIAHDATHSELYHEYKTKYGSVAPDDVWTGADAELFCNAYQLDVLKRIGAPQYEINHLSGLDGTHCDIDHDGDCDWNDYDNRGW